LDFHQYN